MIVRLLAAALSFASALSYVELREGAVAVERPSSAIALLIGACDKGDFVDQTQCQENTKGDRKKIEGKRVVLNLGAGHENMLDFAQLNGDVARFVWTPLYDAGNGLAITVGKPTKVSPQGTIVMNRRPFDGKVADDVTDSDLKRAAKLGQVGIEIVGTFGKPWTLQHGDKTLRGISFEIEGVRFYHSRTGKTLSEGPVSK